jgi:MFS family permease
VGALQLTPSPHERSEGPGLVDVPNAAASRRGRVLRRSRQALSNLTTALHNRDIRRVELVWAVAIGAEWAHFVALGVFAYDHGGASFVGLAGLVRLLPAGALAPFASSLGDRFPRERLLLALFLVEAAALGGSGVAALTGDRETVLLMASVIGATSTLVRPAMASTVPSLARTSRELVATNGASAIFEGLGALGGPLVVGATIAVVGAGGVFIATGMAVLLAAVMVTGVHVPQQSPFGAAAGGSTAAVPGPTRPSSPLRASVAGLHCVARDPDFRLLIGLGGAQCFVRGCLNVLVVVTAFGVLHAGSSGVGYLNAALGIGGLVGAFGAAALSTKRLAFSFGVALAFWGAPIALLAPLPWLGAALLCLVVVGAANAVEDIGIVTILQRVCPDELLSSVFGVNWGIAMIAVAVGSIVAPAIVVAYGDRVALLLVGLILPLLAVLSNRALCRVDARHGAAEVVHLVEAIPMFAPLSIAVKEQVASSLTPVSVAAGETVIGRGEPGDLFYVVVNGRLVIERDGVLVASAEGGDYFGEVALIHDVPRTATVRAERDSTLYTLGRRSFVTAITGHPDALAAARQVADERRPGPGQLGRGLRPSS